MLDTGSLIHLGQFTCIVDGIFCFTCYLALPFKNLLSSLNNSCAKVIVLEYGVKKNGIMKMWDKLKR